MAVSLIVKRGPDMGKRIELKKNEVVVGRDSSADVVINDQTVSRKHCIIRILDDKIIVSDLQSSNKTAVNGIPIDGEYVINEEDEVTLGETILTFRITSIQDQPEIQEEINYFEPQKTIVVKKENVTIEKISNNLEVLYKVNSAIHSIRDKNQLIKILLDLIFEVIPADRGAILLYDNNTKSLIPQVVVSRNKNDHEDVHVSQTISNQVFKNKVAIIIRDALADSRFMDKQTIIQQNIRSAMCVPIGTMNNMLGVIHLDNRIQSGIFTEKDLDLLSAIANQAAIAIENIQFFQRLHDENQQLQKALQKEYNMIGQSRQIQNIFDMIRRLNQTDSTIMIRGESGTGKELVARAIHFTSCRKDKPFICVNCAALNKNLLESELFGHEKGAFTGATFQKKGRFELADQGTIFLDEIGELSLESQVKLLRVLEENKLERVGGTHSVDINARIIAATNRDLEQAIKQKEFREDLYFRLNVIQIDLPSLRERREDIVPLALFFLNKYKEKASREVLQFSPEALNLLKSYHWPGNVRELKNAIERAVVLGNSNIIIPEDLPLNLSINSNDINENEFKTLDQVEREHILKALNVTGWNKKKASDLLGIQRSTLYEKMKAYNIAL